MSGSVWIGDVQVHPAANLFPEMEPEELNKLIESVRKDGVRVALRFYDGKLLDGRNRLRAALAAGINSEKLPRVNVPAGTDPYQEVWRLNCERLDYSPAQKAEIHARILAASGELARIAQEAKVDANESRAEKKAEAVKSQPREADGRLAPAPSAPSREGGLGRRSHGTGPHKSKAAQKVAAATGVSPATAERQIRKLRETREGQALAHARSRGRPRRAGGLYHMPRALPRTIPELGRFLRSHLTSGEVRRLIDDLKKALPET